MFETTCPGHPCLELPISRPSSGNSDAARIQRVHRALKQGLAQPLAKSLAKALALALAKVLAKSLALAKVLAKVLAKAEEPLAARES